MENENTVETVARLMNDLRHCGSGTYTLIAINHQLNVTNKKDLPPYSIVVDKFISTDINDGLTCKRWTDLQAKILTLIHKGKLR